MSNAIDEERNRGASIGRRAFARAALAGGAAAIVASGRHVAAQSPLTDEDLFNFQLNLEYMEAEFYTLAASGVSISSPPFRIPLDGVGTQGPTLGWGRVAFNDSVLEQVVLEIAYNERQHILGLREVLGAAAVAKPSIDFSALGPPTVARLLQAGRIFEDLGSSGLAGASALLVSSANRLIVGRALPVEGQHALSHRIQMLQRGIPDLGPVDAKDVIVSASPRPGARLITADLQGFIPTRTPSEILAVLYGPDAPSGTTAGLLFPNGVNGAIRMV